MPLNARLQTALGLCLAAGLLLAACQPAGPTVPVTAITTPATPTTAPTNPSLPSPIPSPTAVVAAPTATGVATASASPAIATPTTGAATTGATSAVTVSATSTPTNTPTSSSALLVTPTRTAKPTGQPQPSATSTAASTPNGPPPPPPLFSTTTGPAGYTTSLQCQRAGAPCSPVMPPGDLNFHLTLASDTSAPWTHFINYGLSVEKDGANVAEMFMFVDAGWLQPGAVVGFGASRNFSQPGVYVIRSSGCLTTDLKATTCGWQTIAGDVVSFAIR